MDIFSAITGGIKLVLDFFNVIRGVKKEEKDSSKKIFSPKTISAIRLQTKYLQQDIKNLKAALNKDDPQELRKEYANFIKTFNAFLRKILQIDILLFDLYSKSIGGLLAQLMGNDSRILEYFSSLKASRDRWQLSDKISFIKNFEMLKGELERMGFEGRGRDVTHPIYRKEKLTAALNTLNNNLNGVNQYFEDLLKNNWTPKDLS
ncbi:hypothetical protein [Segetibacter aerophilus]|uniref:Uncharacterized protein n=1 Tax=Segetibacter aerophilus TaxID=670293 RepID=A0A512BAA6_9BACT|nr:hypothetical protein [Segetibacter aerophilus]GEO08767.1 hypothetical protein SAE01_12630 [Segetibacter aerophilus]